MTTLEIRRHTAEQPAGIDADGRSVCVLLPDGTRTCPLPLLFGAVHGRCTAGIGVIDAPDDVHLASVSTRSRRRRSPTNNVTSASGSGSRARSATLMPASLSPLICRRISVR
jgi:hypothetical protein